MSKIIPKAYICGKVTGDGKIIMVKGHIYRFKKNCQKYCDQLNSQHPNFIFHVLVANDWRISNE